ncbi:MAG: folylpolyglutamate synthase/dihydrofolate synthase family protein [Cyanobacteria bacterium P01_H01_bin.15]
MPVVDLNSLLQPYARFGVHLGLARIQQLLARLGSPQEQVPIVHVAGSNGKGSVCAYVASILTTAGYRVGRFTSPHLQDWTERICINNHPIEPVALAQVLQYIEERIPPDGDSPTQFEILTAAAFLYFAEQRVDIAVIEVGLGGRLDATNVCDYPLVTAITSISLEHWQRLGPTIADIAREKAGILKPRRPAVIAPLSPEAQAVVEARVAQLNCEPVLWVTPAIAVSDQTARYGELEFERTLLGDFQLTNAAVAIAIIEQLQLKNWQITAQQIQTGLKQTQWLGRLHWSEWRGQPLLIDGAHNPEAAEALGRYVETLAAQRIWVMGMLMTKDHRDIFAALLKPGDHLWLTSVPDHQSELPAKLAKLAQDVCPELASCQTASNVFTALEQAQQITDGVHVLCGSLYLIGHFLANSTPDND